jgi:RHS repeat-associated protein
VQQGISSKAFGRLENNKKYNGIEYEKALDLNVYDAQFRELDPQVGRWWQVDPKTDEMYRWSTYASNFDNPIRFEDHLGDVPNGCCKGLVAIGRAIGNWAYNNSAYALIKTPLQNHTVLGTVLSGDKTAAIGLVSFGASKVVQGQQVFTNGTAQQKTDFVVGSLLDAGAAYVLPKLASSGGNTNTAAGTKPLLNLPTIPASKIKLLTGGNNLSLKMTPGNFKGSQLGNPLAYTADQKALKTQIVEQQSLNTKYLGSNALTTQQAQTALQLGNEVNAGSLNPLKLLNHTFSSGNNPSPGHFANEGTNGHIHVGHGKNSHIPVNQ